MPTMQRAVILMMILYCLPAVGSEPLRIAVAANFRATLETINQQYTERTGQKVLLSSASTGTLANQVLYGAPFDLFLAADKATPLRLLKEGKGFRLQCYAQGSLVLVGGDLNSLSRPGLSLAIANPVTAPYGRAAMEVLAKPQHALDRTLVRGTNVMQAYQFWRAGAADMALVARALAPAATNVPVAWHRPLEQHLIVLSDSPQVNAYLQWLGSDTVRQTINQAGYLPCP